MIIIICVGFPYEGPAPLEAINRGCIFLNPKLKTPISNRILTQLQLDRYNSDFLNGKPTQRFIYSQNSYCDEYIGIPYVYTLSIDDEKYLREKLNIIKNQSLFPTYLSHEFSLIGMLERMNFFMTKQNLCEINYSKNKNLVILYGKKNQDCQTVCKEKEMICEHNFFNLINTFPNKECLKLENDKKLVLPAHIFIDDHYMTCPQTEKLHYSCVDKYIEAYRICPCRKYIKGNIAIY
ncbi:hypothetical protein HZS_1510 [Henneguya salminicola]|nr:hypothetical protein HZS_1510 [Henneguya salminicola]